MIIKKNWNAWKSMVNAKKLPYIYSGDGSQDEGYQIRALWGNYGIEVSITADDDGNFGPEKAEFESDYMPYANRPARLEYNIVEESPDKKTGGHFGTTDLKCDVPSGTAGDWSNHDFTWPIPVTLMAAEWPAVSENDGDEIEVQIAPDTTIGAITQDISISDTVIKVQQSVIDNIQVGYWMSVTDGTNTDDLGRVTVVDSVNLQVTVETASTNAYSAATPTYVRMTVKMVPWKCLKGSGFLNETGHSKIGGSTLPSNTTMRIRYRNNETTAKVFVVAVEYLY